MYVYVFGERIAHLHFNLAPHHEGDALVGGPGLIRTGAPVAPNDVLRAISHEVETALHKDI